MTDFDHLNEQPELTWVEVAITAVILLVVFCPGAIALAVMYL